MITALLEIKSKNKEISLHNEEYARARSDIEKLQIENRKIRTIATILNGATNGLHKTRPETIKLANRAVEYIQQYKGPAEEKFKDCWNRRLNTTNWGSDGPYGLLDECIDSIENTDAAIFIRELENSTNAARSSCSEGENRYEMAKSCWADRNFRLIQSANHAIFH